MDLATSYTSDFPLIRGGALFVMIVGAAIMIGAISFQFRNRVLFFGARALSADGAGIRAACAGARCVVHSQCLDRDSLSGLLAACCVGRRRRIEDCPWRAHVVDAPVNWGA
jgi:hypothetical protein